MTAMEPGRERLASAMDERRLRLRLRWHQVASRASFSLAQLKRIRNGEGTLTDFAKAGIEDALQWPRGAADRIVEGPWDDEVAKLIFGDYDQPFGDRTRQRPGPDAHPQEQPKRTARFDDPGLQAIWEITELNEIERRAAIFTVRNIRGEFDLQADSEDQATRFQTG